MLFRSEAVKNICNTIVKSTVKALNNIENNKIKKYIRIYNKTKVDRIKKKQLTLIVRAFQVYFV